MLNKNPSMVEHLSKNFKTSCKNSVPFDVVLGGIAPSACVDGLLFASSSGLLVEVSKYESKQRMQSRPAFANTKVFSVSKKMRKISMMTLEIFNFFVVKVPKSGRQPDLISVRCASTIIMQHVMI